MDFMQLIAKEATAQREYDRAVAESEAADRRRSDAWFALSDAQQTTRKALEKMRAEALAEDAS